MPGVGTYLQSSSPPLTSNHHKKTTKLRTEKNKKKKKHTRLFYCHDVSGNYFLATLKTSLASRSGGGGGGVPKPGFPPHGPRGLHSRARVEAHLPGPIPPTPRRGSGARSPSGFGPGLSGRGRPQTHRGGCGAEGVPGSRETPLRKPRNPRFVCQLGTRCETAAPAPPPPPGLFSLRGRVKLTLLRSTKPHFFVGWLKPISRQTCGELETCGVSQDSGGLEAASEGGEALRAARGPPPSLRAGPGGPGPPPRPQRPVQAGGPGALDRKSVV